MSPEVVASWVATALILAFIAITIHRERIPRSGRNPYYHILYVGFALAIVLLFPQKAQLALFSPLTVAVVGTVFPIFESIRAVCTPGTDDDKCWLVYWIAQGALSYSTEWVDDVAQRNQTVREYWYKFEFLFLLWMLLPFTNGAGLLFNYFTEPYLAPLIRPIAARFEGWLNMVVMTVINASHLWFLWITFVFLPTGLKRFITVSFGNIYPLMGSVVALTTGNTDDDTFWLTYWSCYSVLFLIMDWIENYIGKIPGFYTLFLFATVYLMLPLFRGAEQVFRKILVPLSGQREMLLIRDAYKLKKDMEKDIPPERLEEVRRVMAASFVETDGADLPGSSAENSSSTKNGYQSINQEEVANEANLV